MGGAGGWTGRLTGRENLEFYAALYGLPRASVASKLDALMMQASLQAMEREPVSTYTLEQRKRLSVIRALLRDPAILLLAHPQGQLDPWQARAFLDWFKKEWIERQKKTVVLATHRPEDAEVLCHRAAWMKQGKLLWIGSPAEGPWRRGGA